MPHLALWLPGLVISHAVAVLWVVLCARRTAPCKPPRAVADIRHALPPEQPQQPTVLLAWHNVCRQVTSAVGSSKLQRAVLQHVSGAMRAHEMHALLGPSGAHSLHDARHVCTVLSSPHGVLTSLAGAGKSSLLETLAAPGLLKGVSGCLTSGAQQRLLWSSPGAAPATQPSAGSSTDCVSGGGAVVLIPQHDLLLPLLTARESLQFVYRISHPDSATQPCVADLMLTAMALQAVADVQVRYTCTQPMCQPYIRILVASRTPHLPLQHVTHA